MYPRPWGAERGWGEGTGMAGFIIRDDIPAMSVRSCILSVIGVAVIGAGVSMKNNFLLPEMS